MQREGVAQIDWCEMTMSMMREKQFEACERRLFAYPPVSLFSENATELDAMRIANGSFETLDRKQLVTLKELRERVMFRLPLEAQYISVGEMQLLERLLINNGEIMLGEWDDIGAAEALVKRMWCSFHANGEEWTLRLPKPLHDPLMFTIHMPETAVVRERVFRFDATIHGLLYVAGLLHSAQPAEVFMREVMKRDDEMSIQIAKRYLQSSFEYILDARGDLILLHPGLADPYRMFQMQPVEGIFTLELSQEMIAGGMNGILPEEIPLHEQLCGAFRGALRPEYDLGEAAEDLRILAKQGVSLREIEEVMASLLSVLPTESMKYALKTLYQCTPRWLGLKTPLVQ